MSDFEPCIPDHILIPAAKGISERFNKSADTWDLEHVFECREMCGAKYRYTALMAIKNRAIQLRKSGKLSGKIKKEGSANAQRFFNQYD